MSDTKKKFKMPHLFWIMMGLLLVMSLLTYVIPAGQFATDENGKIIGDQFAYLGHQTPIGPWQVLMMMLPGLTSSANVSWMVMVSGAMTYVVMATGAIDEFMNWAIYKLKDKNENILIASMFILMVYLGGFGGSDALVAVVPLGVLFAKKMNLDPICALGFSTFATLLGFGTGPVKQSVSQGLMGVPIYGAFFTMFISMNFFMALGLFFLLRYVKKIRKNPQASLMYSEGWRPSEAAGETKVELKEVHLSWRTIAILCIFLGQYAVIVAYPLMGGKLALYTFMVGINLTTAVICGFIGGFSFDKIAGEFVKGLQGLVLIGFVIGLAKVMSNIMFDGNIMHTIVYVLIRPLLGLPRFFASIGMTAVVSVANLLIPSASSKAAILIPILKPISEALNLPPELAIQAFQYGDGFTNYLSPFFGWLMGSLAMANVPFQKWIQWIVPKIIVFMICGFLIMIVLTESGWTAF